MRGFYHFRCRMCVSYFVLFSCFFSIYLQRNGINGKFVLPKTVYEQVNSIKTCIYDKSLFIIHAKSTLVCFCLFIDVIFLLLLFPFSLFFRFCFVLAFISSLEPVQIFILQRETLSNISSFLI